jgi:hypothetical protein
LGVRTPNATHDPRNHVVTGTDVANDSNSRLIRHHDDHG